MKTMRAVPQALRSSAWRQGTVVAALMWLPAASAPAGPLAAPPEPPIAALRPDYRQYIGDVRRLDLGAPDRRPADRPVYMALVRPGSAGARGTENAPLTGGVRNDILYDPAGIGSGRSPAWTLLLFDHEYFHARHLAGTTSLPLPGRVFAEVERHFYEAAAWGWNVAEARAGSYPGLRPDEFRETLDRYGEHFAALRALMRERDPAAWRTLSELIRRPPALITRTGSRPATGPVRPSGWDRSTATPGDTAERARADGPGGTPAPGR